MSDSRATPARLVAYEVIRRTFEQDAYTDRALRAACDRYQLEGAERSSAQRLAYGAVQRRGSSDHLIAKLASRRLTKIDPPLLAALRLGLFELLFEHASDHAAVDQAVELAKGGGGGRQGAGMVNAILRRAARDGEEMLADFNDADPAAASVCHSVPEWIVKLWWEELGPERARAELVAANEARPRCFRPAKPTADLPSGLAPAPPLSELEGQTGLLVADADAREEADRAVGEGGLIPQSSGSAFVVDLLDVRPGQRVLDLCAAPGTKTSQIATTLDRSGELTAVEADAARARALTERLADLGHQRVVVEVGDGRRIDLRGGYDRVLVDAPCTGLGTLASRPDIRWRGGPRRVGPTVDLQRGLLRRGLDLLAPGGRLVYSTCTINRAEGSELVADVPLPDAVEMVDLGSGLAQFADEGDRRFLQLLPSRDGTDGFFVAALERSVAE